MMQNIMNYSFLGNSVQDYLIALGIFVGGFAVALAFRRYILGRLKRWADLTVTSVDNLLVHMAEKYLLPLSCFSLLYLSLHTLELTPGFGRGLDIILILVMTVVSVSAISTAVDFGLGTYMHETDDAAQRAKQLSGIRGLFNFVIWGIALIFMLDNLGVKISAAVAGLGIGGIAVALAAQAILGDLFSYFVIFFDKPFQTGDFIIIGDKMGVVEHIGIKTTRIRALSGEQLIFSNTDLTNSRVHNYKRMEKRRVLFKLGVIYQTSAEKLRAVPGIVKRIIDDQENASFDRGHFAAYGDFSLDFEFVYYVSGADYNTYMDTQQSINFAIFEEFAKQGIEFAYPTQTVFMNRSPS